MRSATPALFWLVQTSASLPETDDWLGPRERAVLAGLRVAKRRGDWRLGRWTAKQALRSVLARGGPPPDARELEIVAAQDGAPEAFLGGQRVQFSVSLSHSATSSLCVVAANGLEPGCDLERIEPRDARFVADYFAPEEAALFRTVPEDQRPLCATLIWSAKESALKSSRQGMRRDARSVIVHLVEGLSGASGWNPLRVDCAQTPMRWSGWWTVVGECVATLVSIDPRACPEPLRV